MKANLIFLWLFFVFSFTNLLIAQQEANQPIASLTETNDGNSHLEQINKLNEATALLTESGGTQPNQVAKPENQNQPAAESGQNTENLHGNRYFVLSNSLGIPKGVGYYQNSWIFFNQVHYGITNNIAIGAGVVPLFLFAGTPSPVWIVPSVTFPISKDRFSLGANALIGTIAGGDTRGPAGFLSFTGTIGNRRNNLTLGLGYGYLGDDWARSPLVSISGMVRTGPRHSLLTENYFVSGVDEFNLISFFGGRVDFRAMSFDYGLLIPLYEGIETFVGIPWLSIAVPFGRQ